MALYHYSIQRYLDQWFGRKSNDKYGQQTKARGQNADNRTKEERKKMDEQNQHQSKGRTENKKYKDERYFEAILGLQPSKSIYDIKNRELVMQYHPDMVAHFGPKLREFAEQQMKEINDAYDFFKNKYGLS